ncbi:outer membrane beta-barrel protein [Flavobacterium urocaniciphilum]|uniref:Putative beta-barrel porin-2, OmpL-like. bbp2 n=1 Tax=Flavobacterium urocaniciphilum TaxID=1299341 RepID=A0A1H8ZM26_9FLAO|nr:outer membrane beta-barrel protein [Flavobacterium urocaniciphilum]SEP65321.1 Putative beta-barrel porin-2, OmpL-like. bbp2 [Flavobacterium urocaniciphilum]
MIKKLIFITLITQFVWAQNDTIINKIPFENYNLNWVNGQNRQKDFHLQLKDSKGETILTGVVYLDGHFNYNFSHPKDNTQTISAVTARSNEFSLALASIGIESNYKNTIGRLWLQTGSMLNIIQETDGSIYRGRNTSTGNLKFIREAAAGYHFNVNYGLNVEMGIFMSYIGLESYLTQENWSYQRSMVCDFTPFYFQGARVQYLPTKNYKTEVWLLNGWQSYNSWNKNPGIGNSNYYRPTENIQLVANFYYGKDSKSGSPELSNIMRFHHDNSIVYRYFKNETKKHGLSQAAFSLNNHYGFQQGDGLKSKENFMMGSSLVNRLWFNQNKIGWTSRIDYVTNPGGYLAFTPAQSGAIPNDYEIAIANGKDLKMCQFSTTFDFMPNDIVTFRLEYAYRNANVPYFTGSGGTTSQTGFSNDTLDPNWKADLKKFENRIILAVNFRL